MGNQAKDSRGNVTRLSTESQVTDYALSICEVHYTIVADSQYRAVCEQIYRDTEFSLTLHPEYVFIKWHFTGIQK